MHGLLGLLRKCLPLLLKIVLFVLSKLIFIPFFSVYEERLSSIFCIPSSVSDKTTKSSAHKMHPMVSVLPSCKGLHSVLLNKGTMSDKKILNNRGLRMHPCFAPWLTSNTSVILFQTLTQHSSFK